jgi:hypothetical protein
MFYVSAFARNLEIGPIKLEITHWISDSIVIDLKIALDIAEN